MKSMEGLKNAIQESDTFVLLQMRKLVDVELFSRYWWILPIVIFILGLALILVSRKD